MRLVSRLLPPLGFALSLAACNTIFGIEQGVLGAGGTGGTASSGSTTGSGTSSASTAGGTSSASTGGGAPCAPADSATCQGAVLQVCDVTGHTAVAVTCDAVAACDAIAQRCNDLPSMPRLGVGHARACAIEDDYSVKCWGANGNTTLLPLDPIDQVRLPEKVDGVVGARQVTVGEDHQCVLQDDGTVTCWGEGGSGQLGGQQGGSQVPAPVPNLDGVVEVRASPACTCARRFDGSIQCFGIQDYGCIGTASSQQGAQPSPTDIGVSGAVALRLGWYGPSCALLKGGVVTCWNDQIVPTPVPGVTSAVEIAVGWGHVFIRDQNGVYESTAKPDNSGWTAPVQWDVNKPVTALAAGDQVCALLMGGAVSCTALDGTNPAALPSPIPMQPPGNVVEIAAGNSWGYFRGLGCLRVAGSIASSVYCWGDDGGGALGAGAPEDILAPEAPAVSSAVQTLTTAERSTAVVLADGTVQAWGDLGAFFQSERATPTDFGILGNDNALIQDHDIEQRAYAIKKSGALVLVSGGTAVPNAGLELSGFTDFIDARIFYGWDVGLRKNGTVVVFAGNTDANKAGIFGDGTTTATANTTPTVSGIGSATALAAFGLEYDPGHAQLCVIQSSPAGSVWCWGSNDDGEVGTGTLSPLVLTPTQVVLPNNEQAASIAVGDSFTCAATTAGNVYCWGDNSLGQIGQTQGGTYVAPKKVPLGAAASGVTARDDHACAWLADGHVACWGRNNFGQLGDGTFHIPSSPVMVQNVTTAIRASAGVDHTCALLTGGAVTCWGSSYDGEVGTGKTGEYGSPQAVKGL